MTVICWDGTTLAADKQASMQGLKRSVTKIKKVKGHLLFASGDFDSAQEMYKWWEDGADPEKFPACQKDKDAWVSLHVITPKKQIIVYDRQPSPFRCENKIHATGSGRDYALTAMYLGRNAVEAANIACHFEVSCGMGIDTLTLGKG